MVWPAGSRRRAAVAGAVVGHGLAYALAVPEPGRRLAVLAGSGHAYWSAAIAAAIVLGLVSLGATLARHFRAGLRTGGRPAAESLGRLVARLALLQVTIYLVQELIERAAAGVPLGGPVDGRLLFTGIAVQLLVAASWPSAWPGPAGSPRSPAAPCAAGACTAPTPPGPPPPHRLGPPGHPPRRRPRRPRPPPRR